MCNSPLRIQRYMKPETLGLRYDMVRKYVPERYRSGYLPYLMTDSLVPCGKCCECLKSRQNEIAVRASLEAVHQGSMALVTLTYNDRWLPVSVRLCLSDKETGEMFMDGIPYILPDDDVMLEYYRENLRKIKPGRLPRYDYYVDEDYSISKQLLGHVDCNYQYSYCATPSLNRRDVRLWIKNCRVKYKRHYGETLKFTYLAVGEMGPKTCRPHYHVCLFGLDKRQVLWMSDQWKYGFSQVKMVNRINKDGSKGFIAAAKYVGKYVSKGCFECRSVKDGNCEKPRLFMSIGIGYHLSDEQIAYYRGYDVNGYYDVDRPFNSVESMSLVDLHRLYDVLRQRRLITIEGLSFALPKYILKKLFYVQSQDKRSFRPSVIQMVFTGFLLSDDVSRFVGELRQSGVDMESKDVASAVGSFKSMLETCKNVDEQAFFNRQSGFYSKSAF